MRVRRTQCKTCIFGPRSPQADGGLEDMLSECAATDSFVVCHASTIAAKGKGGDTVCGGYWTNVYMETGRGQLLRIMERLNAIEFVDDDYAGDPAI